MGDHNTNSFNFRLKRKLNEHFSQDSSGISFCKYSVKWLTSKFQRRVSDAFHSPTENSIETNPNAVQIAVRISGGLGDHIVLARVLRDLQKSVGNLEFFLFLPQLSYAAWAFAGIKNVKDFFPEVFMERFKHDCDCALYLNSFAFFDEEYFNTQKIQKIAPKLLEVIAATIRNRRPWNVFIDNHPTLDGAFARQAVAIGKNRYSFINSLLDIPSGGEQYELPFDNSISEEVQKKFPLYLTINTGFDNHFIISSRLATKCYPTDYWHTLVKHLKSAFPKIGVVQIGGKNSVHISGCDFNYAGITSLEKSAGLLKSGVLHIDIEGGLVHAAASLNKRSIVLLGPTSDAYFAYPQNINLRTNNCSECWWATERWMECCPKKQSRAECMYFLTPELVFEAVATILKEVK